MVNIGKNINVVKLMGDWKKSMDKMEMLVVVE